MSIVTTEITAISGGSPRAIFYRCQDHLGVWHEYGPVFSSDPAFDPEVFKATVATKIEAALEAAELEEFIDG